MQKVKLDSIDRKILSELQANGRITNVELAKRVDISAPPCLRRVRALEDANLIRGYHADLDPKGLGFEVSCFVQIRLAHQADSELRAFEAKVQTWPLVRECHLLQGDYDYLLKCVARDLDDFQKFLTEDVLPAANVDNVKTSIVVRTAKDEPGVPVEEPADADIAERIEDAH